MPVARISTFAVGVTAIAFGLLAQGVNVAVLVVLAINVVASANFPVLALSLFWRRFNTWGVIGGVIGGVTAGLVSSVVLALLGPAGLGPDATWPLVNRALVSMPLGFAGAVIGTVLGGRRNVATEERCDEVIFRAHTGVGAEV